MSVLLFKSFLLCIVTVFAVLSFSIESKPQNLETVIEFVEKEFEIPKGLLNAIAKIESGIKPYAVNASKIPYYFSEKAKAEKFILDQLKKGHKNISVGCLQLLYVAHKGEFGHSVGNMLDPEKNIRYAAKLLKKLRNKYGSWGMAVRKYHSNSPSKASAYYRKVTNKLGHPI
jgi:soluble lytic murein transglycosylase-like protein